MEYIGLDIGTHTIRYIKDNNILFDQPALLAFDANKKTMAIGTEASQLRGTRHVRSYRRLSELYSYLDEIFTRYDSFRLFHKTTVFFTTPSTFDKKQCEKIRNHILEQGATQVLYDKELWCAAIGAKLQINTSVSACMLYMVHASCDIACFSNGIIQKESHSPYGGAQILHAFNKWIQTNYDLQVSQPFIENLLLQFGQTKEAIVIHGTDMRTQQNRRITITQNQIGQVLSRIVYAWSQWIYTFLTTLSNQQQGDLLKRGIVCCGGLMEIPHIDTILRQQLNVPFFISPNPQYTISYGIMTILNRLKEEE